MDQRQATEQSRRVAGVFDRAAATYDGVGVAWFTPIGESLVSELAPSSGERALDIGCGRGAALFPLARAVGPTGRVTGIDLAPAMVAATAADVRARGLSQVDLQVMDASAPDLNSSSYDVIASSLVIFFLPDPAAGLHAWRQMLTPDGRLGISTFGTRDPRWVELDAVFRPYLPPDMLDARTSGTAGPFASDEGVEALVLGAGYRAVRTVSWDLPLAFTDAEQWHTWSWSHGQRAMWEAVPEAERPVVRAAAAEQLENCRDKAGQITLTQRVRLTVATA